MSFSIDVDRCFEANTTCSEIPCRMTVVSRRDRFSRPVSRNHRHPAWNLAACRVGFKTSINIYGKRHRTSTAAKITINECPRIVNKAKQLKTWSPVCLLSYRPSIVLSNRGPGIQSKSNEKTNSRTQTQQNKTKIISRHPPNNIQTTPKQSRNKSETHLKQYLNNP
jgi:hypothetical protein